MKGDNSGFV
uniref:Uncharacterized protein n=1 Tax=Anguilla anguilla TaxID=7936 RepID=A0A0E9XNG2_ANGAN